MTVRALVVTCAPGTFDRGFAARAQPRREPLVILRKLSRRVKLPLAIAKQAAATPAPEQPAAPAA